MDQKDFFDFSSYPEISNRVQTHCTDASIDKFKLIKGDYAAVDFPLIFKQESGNQFCDIVDTGYPSFFLISENMRMLLEKNNITGWKVFPITFYDKKGNEVVDYYGFSVIGQCGPKSYEKSEIIEKRLVPNGPLCKYYKGVSFENWDGSDFFTPESTYPIFINKKAADLLRKNKISNLYLRNLAEIETNARYVT